jgi:DNA-damage-inducible protein J
MIHVRIDDATKERASLAVEAMGLSLSDAVRLFLRRVVADQALPFELKVPNAATRAAIGEADALALKHTGRFASADAMFADLEKNSGK